MVKTEFIREGNATEFRTCLNQKLRVIQESDQPGKIIDIKYSDTNPNWFTALIIYEQY